jgi:hypothetical protein
VSNSNIGIKIADGSFYPILESGSQKKKKLILTTVNDNQANVQIDLYEGEGRDISSNRYVGSLMIEDLAEGPAGDPEIELLVGTESDGKLSAQAQDLRTGESQSLNVSLESVSEDSIYDMPDFELDNEFEPWDTKDDFEADDAVGAAEAMNFDEESIEDETFTHSGSIEDDIAYEDSEPAYVEPPKRKPLLLALFIIFGIAAVAALAILLFKLFEGPKVPSLEARGGNTVGVAAGEEPGSSENASTAESDNAGGEATSSERSASGQPEGSAASKNAVSSGPRDGPAETPVRRVPAVNENDNIGGVWYWITWGDTLWDISSSFYRNPWYYGKIAEKNSIQNPDLIIAGSKIFIPEQ